MTIIKEIPSMRCGECGCVFEFDSGDVKDKTYFMRKEIFSFLPIFKKILYKSKYVICPVCWKEIELWNEPL